MFSEFFCNLNLLKFVVLRNGLSPGPRKITKITKPPLEMLRVQGYTVAIYTDGIIAIDQSFEERLLTVVETSKFVSVTGLCNTPREKQVHTIQNSSISWFVKC